jgi:DNA-binding transcriptional LysR family regulator
VELRYLESFLAIADELHFGRAAARLHISQPSLSQHLQRLERSVGVRLVDRGPHQVALTEAGQVFRTEAQRLLGELRAAVELTREVGRGQAGTVRVGFNYPAGRRVLPGTLNTLASRYPRLRPVLVEQRSGPQLADLATGELDVALVFGTPSDSYYASRTAFRTSLVALVGATHPLAGRSEVPFAELAQHPCILFDRELSPTSHDTLTAAARQRDNAHRRRRCGRLAGHRDGRGHRVGGRVRVRDPRRRRGRHGVDGHRAGRSGAGARRVCRVARAGRHTCCTHLPVVRGDWLTQSYDRRFRVVRQGKRA